MADPDIEVGLVRSVNPGKRSLRVKAARGYARVFAGMAWARFRLRGGAHLRCKVETVLETPLGPALTLAAGVPRENVGRLKGAVVLMTEAEMPAGGGNFEVAALAGMQVHDEAGVLLGRVREVYEAPSNDAFCVELVDGRRIILPVIDQVIAEVDVDEARLLVKDIRPYVVEES